MANKRNKAWKRQTSRARSIRAKRSLPEESNRPSKESNQIPEESSCPQSNHVRMIMSTMALENVLRLVTKHTRECMDSDFRVNGVKSSLLQLDCLSCGKIILARKDSESSHHLTIPDGLAAAAVCAGVGYSAIKTICATLEISPISKPTYLAAEEKIGKSLEKMAQLSFKETGEKEKRLAIEAGDVIKLDGMEYPFINVTVDAGWAKRSYGHSYNSNAGVGIIIGE